MIPPHGKRGLPAGSRVLSVGSLPHPATPGPRERCRKSVGEPVPAVWRYFALCAAPDAELTAVRQQIARETGKIINALNRDVTTAQIRVKNLETVVAKAGTQAGEPGGEPKQRWRNSIKMLTQSGMYIPPS